MAYKRIKLASGNVFYFSPETATQFAYAFVVSESLDFIGGFLCKEAIRKLNVFSSFAGNVVEEVDSLIDFKYINFRKFAEKLGSASNIFVNHFNDLYDDISDSYRGNACNERLRYYSVVGCNDIYNSSKKFQLGLLIANHVAIFGTHKFDETFFKYKDEYQSDLNLCCATRYDKSGNFKAPAYYLRRLANSRSN